MSGLSMPPAFVLEGLCGQVDPDIFFPNKGQSPRDALSVCFACPVRMACLEWSLETHQRFGVWGGVGERERRRIMRARASAGGGRQVA